MINIVFLLDTLWDNKDKRLRQINQSRLNQLRPYANDANYSVFVYGSCMPFELRMSELQLKIFGLKPDQICLYSNLPGKKACFQRGTKYFADKEREGEEVIIVGSSQDRYINGWIQDNNYSIVDWPYDTETSLGKLIDEQLYLTKNSSNSSVSVPTFAVNGLATLTPSDIPDFKSLVEEMIALRNDIFNLTRTIVDFQLDQRQIERTQINLIKLLLQSEEKQTGLIELYFEHYPLEYTIIGLTASHIIVSFSESIYKACKSRRGVGELSTIAVSSDQAKTLLDSTEGALEFSLLIKNKPAEKEKVREKGIWKSLSNAVSTMFKKGSSSLYRAEMRTAAVTESDPLLARSSSVHYSPTTLV